MDELSIKNQNNEIIHLKKELEELKNFSSGQSKTIEQYSEKIKNEENILKLKDTQQKVRETPVFNKPFTFKPDNIQTVIEHKSGSHASDTIGEAAKALKEADEAMNQARQKQVAAA